MRITKEEEIKLRGIEEEMIAIENDILAVIRRLEEIIGAHDKTDKATVTAMRNAKFAMNSGLGKVKDEALKFMADLTKHRPR